MRHTLLGRDLVVGVVISLLQALTQIQEATVAFLPGGGDGRRADVPRPRHGAAHAGLGHPSVRPGGGAGQAAVTEQDTALLQTLPSLALQAALLFCRLGAAT